MLKIQSPERFSVNIDPKSFDTKKTVFIIDGSSFLYRAYYSMQPLNSPKGIPVQAVFGFCRMIKKIIDTFNPSYIAIVWDSKGKTTRHEMFPEYKATRRVQPDDLFEQKKIIMQFADTIGLPQIATPGVEADDIMYSLAKERSKEGDAVVMITSDKDMAQALDANTIIFDPFKDEFFGIAEFEKKKGFEVAKLPFFFAILGDTSDNIPGVKGIGEKGATDLVKQFASLQDLYNRLDEVTKARTKALLQEHKDNAFLSEKLFVLHYYPTTKTKEALFFDKNNWSQAAPLFQELAFKSLLKGMDATLQHGLMTAEEKIKKMEKYEFKTITTQEQLAELCYQLREHKTFALDTETTGLDAMNDPMIGISLCYKEGHAYYIPFCHKTDDAQLSKEAVVAALKPIFEDALYKKYLHSAKFDQHVLAASGLQLHGVAFDSYIAAVLLLKDWQSAGLKNLSMHYFEEPMLTFEDVVTKNKYKNFSYVPLELATLYAAVDAHQTFKLKKVLDRQLHQEKFEDLYYGIELPLTQILFAMEQHGIILDVHALKELDTKITAALMAVEAEIRALIGTHNWALNLNSPRQVEELLFVQLQLPPQKKSAKGTGYSTDQEVLEILAAMHPVPKLLLKYRELTKLKNTYIDALPAYINPKTGRIHTTYNQVSVATGRLASYDPNLQNIPLESGIRAAFKPDEGCVFLSADYSQIELRVLAHLSGDKNLIQAFLSGHDIHAQTAAKLFDVSLDQVTNDQRQVGKRINFSILYGLTPYGLSKDLNVSLKDAKTYIEKYFAQYPQVSEWMEKVVAQTKHSGYVTTFWGRRRYIPGIHEKNRNIYEESRRVAINTVAQGTAAEIMKLGMIALDKTFKAQKIDAKMVLQIHDELLISVPKMEQQTTEQTVKRVLESVVTDWAVPLQVSTRIGADWGEVTK